MATRDNKYVKCGLLNVQSVGNKTFEINDLLKDTNLCILALTETWLTEYDTAKISEMTPNSHTFVHVPRSGNKRGGGVGLFLSNSIKKIACKKLDVRQTFEVMCVNCEINMIKCAFIVTYRPPHTNVNAFITEFQHFLESVDMVSAHVIICGDFNIWADNETDPVVMNFIDMMSSFGLSNNVQEATSMGGHILDLVFSESNYDLVSEIKVDELCDISPVHKLITFMLPLTSDKNKHKRISYRQKSNLDPELLINTAIDTYDNKKCNNCIHNMTLSDCTNCSAKSFNDILMDLYESQCPLIEKNIKINDNAPWFNGMIANAKREKRKKERKWRSERTEASRLAYIAAKQSERKLITQRKREYYRNKITEAGNNIQLVYSILNSLTGLKKISKIPEGYPDAVLTQMFLNFFEEKIEKVVSSFVDVNERAPLTTPEQWDNMPKLEKFNQVPSKH